jgi:hypothetical protein
VQEAEEDKKARRIREARLHNHEVATVSRTWDQGRDRYLTHLVCECCLANFEIEAQQPCRGVFGMYAVGRPPCVQAGEA